ncbi:(d)CMP kinase [Chryseobacterium indologenes]|uniref:Cytidylate kinase n=1 Tax=Chryseobacterium indologenes TaxID=253 RepID=A0AAD0YT19_CHRID|nr:(d)CMP kinase [Chryseobacterium indologenes]ATN05106.1 (d)CMP kinase [Chryseobacterium indologenes]AYY86142.1 (d)CMP kinase [Chryseobacterium indologenes]AYZ35913.1 (d)CMP kinase [Chryseobacterium indologenes]AZB16683.1 (d)CMP kinase [Chryseobacterium indologenes]MEB4759690.1 (d)CMP kinase [Chryseobacterium indologenes]
MKKPVIAIDGYSSTGKSSISKIIADKLGLIHMDTGALYRGVTWYALQHCLNDNGQIDLDQLFSSFSNINLEFKNSEGTLVLYLNNEDISKEIRTNLVSENVSLVAKQKEVRDFLLQSQRSLAEKGGVIMDGRDIGTVVLPNADYKFFLTASIDERTNRRFLELKSLGIEAVREQVKQNLIDRDKIDSEREIAPLKQAEDAIVVDNSELTKEETIELILSHIQKI